MKFPKLIPVLFLILALSLPVHAQSLCREFEGLIEPSDLVELSCEVEGVIDQVMVDRGDRVVKGQEVAVLKCEVEKAACALAKARLEFEIRKSARRETLFKKKMISAHEKDELDTQVLLAELGLAEARRRLEQKTLVSPVTGVVVERLLSVGEHLENDAVFNIAQVDPLYVEVVIPVECYGRIKAGQMATAHIEVPFQKSVNCRVKVVDTVIDAASATFNVRLELPNPKGRYPAGVKCRVEFK